MTFDAGQCKRPKENVATTATVRIPKSSLKWAQATAGEYELKPAARRALAQSRREERKGKVRRFTNARDAVAHLKRL